MILIKHDRKNESERLPHCHTVTLCFLYISLNSRVINFCFFEFKLFYTGKNG